MRIKWLGHATFLITSENGVRIITDPYAVAENLKYNEIDETADIVTVSHEHGDHNNVSAVQGNPEVVRVTMNARGIGFKGIATYHDNTGGTQRVKNTVFCFDVDGLMICHLGDLGHILSDEQVTEMGSIDVLLVPVEGFFTLSTDGTTQVCNRLKPKVIIPMHFKNEKCIFPLAGVDKLLEGKEAVSQLDTSEVELKKRGLSKDTRILVLKPAL